MIRELLDKSAWTAQKPRLAPPPGSGAWKGLPAAERLLAAGDEALRRAKKPPALPLKLWLAYTERGDRTGYETPYFARRRTLCDLVMAACAAGGGRYIPAIADYVWAICEESAWQLPAHNVYVRDTPALPLPDTKRPVVDLFAAETGATLALTHLLLGRELDAYAPGLAGRIRDEVRRRVLRPYLHDHFWWMADTDDPKDKPVCNWTPWCTQNMLLAAAALLPARALTPYVHKAAAGLDSFLAEYGEDGCCNEGAQYYGHAALTCYNALELMCRMAPGALEGLWAEPKLRNMAEYIVHMHVAGPYYLNFADCSPLAGRRGAREYLFAKRMGSEPLRTLAARDAAEAAQDSPADNSSGISLYERIQSAFTEAEMRAEAEKIKGRPIPAAADIWYPSVGVLSVRRGTYVLGAKAGCNADSHNHNDTGSLILYKDGRPLLIDVGVESYTAMTFSDRRYEIWTMQSSWHNLPEFDPAGKRYQQLPGPEARAEQVAVDPDLGGLTMDIAAAYGPVPGLGYYRRRMALTADGLTVEDVTDYPGAVALSLMSAQKPETEGNAVRFGSLGEALAQGADRITWEAIPIRDARLRAAWPETIYRTRIYFTGRVKLEVR